MSTVESARTLLAAALWARVIGHTRTKALPLIETALAQAETLGAERQFAALAQGPGGTLDEARTEHQLVRDFRRLGPNAKAIALELMSRLAAGVTMGDFDDARSMPAEARQEGLDLMLYLAMDLLNAARAMRKNPEGASLLRSEPSFTPMSSHPLASPVTRHLAREHELRANERQANAPAPYRMQPEVPGLDKPIPFVPQCPGQGLHLAEGCRCKCSDCGGMGATCSLCRGTGLANPEPT